MRTGGKPAVAAKKSIAVVSPLKDKVDDSGLQIGRKRRDREDRKGRSRS